MPTQTTIYGLDKPLVNNPIDSDLWGGYLNGDMDDIDGLLAVGIKLVSSVKTSNFSVAAGTTGSTDTGDTNKLFRCDTTSGAIVATLPAAASAGDGFFVAFKKTDVSANAVTLTPNGSEKIDGAATFVLSDQYNWVILQCDGTGWNIVSQTPLSTAGLAPLDSPVFTGDPQAPTPAEGDSSASIATTDFVDPARLLATSGYQKLSNGLIIQWGTFTTSNSGFTNITFPVAFATGPYVVTGSFRQNVSFVSGIAFNVGSATTTTVPCASTNAGGGGFDINTISWIAIGI